MGEVRNGTSPAVTNSYDWSRFAVIADHECVERISGDFFRHVPTGVDVYILDGVIHDWNDSEASIILGKVRQAMKPGARVAVLDDTIPILHNLGLANGWIF
jgi:hypothetical protein